jgi:catechol-2,3-dioxygenase
VPSVRLNHAALFVTDLDRSVDFYTGLFGMDVAVRDDGARTVLLRLPQSDNYHDLGLFEVAQEEATRQNEVGLYHLAWQVGTIEELAEFRHQLLTRGCFAGESDHGVTLSVYGSDPDGNDFEIMWMLPRDLWAQHENAEQEQPLRLDDNVVRWAGTNTAR